MSSGVRHVVMFLFKPGTTRSDQASIKQALAELPREIPLIRRFEVGEDLHLAEGNAGLVVIVDFDNVADYLAYSADPRHQYFVREVLTSHLDRRMAVQYCLGEELLE